MKVKLTIDVEISIRSFKDPKMNELILTEISKLERHIISNGDLISADAAWRYAERLKHEHPESGKAYAAQFKIRGLRQSRIKVLEK